MRGFAIGCCLLWILSCAASQRPIPAPAATVDRATSVRADEPPLTSTTAHPEELPGPIPSFATLSEQERRLVAEHLRATARTVSAASIDVHELPGALELCTSGDADLIKRRLRPLLANPDDLIVNTGCHSMTPLSRIGPNQVRAEFVAKDAIDVDQVWAAIVQAFPDACHGDIDPNSRAFTSDRLSRSFASNPFRVEVTPGFKGIVVKEQLNVKLEDRSKLEGGAVAQGLYLMLESKIYWRRASASEWNLASTVEALDPGMLSDGARTALARCGQGLLRTILR
jgi:hypothetical protein